MDIFQNFDLLTVGVAIASIGLLGFIVYFNKPKSITNQTFLVFSLVSILWSISNYSSYQIKAEYNTLLLLRLVMYFAVWYSFFLFQLFYVFPVEEIIFPNYYKRILVPTAFITSLLTLTPLLFSKISNSSAQGKVSTATVGPGIFIFGIVVIFFIASGLTKLYNKFRQAKLEQKTPLILIFIGAIITFTLHIIFNFILPAFFNQTRFIPFGALFTFPLIAFTTYAILKHHLLNLKIITTEILTFALAIAILLDVVISPDPISRLFRFIIFLLVIGVGVLLIKSVRREVHQREQLEILDKELADANEKLKNLDLARAEFISIASHQLRTPPATVKWYLSSIIDGDYGKLPKKVTEELKKTQNTNNHLISLIEDMLNVSRIERGKMEFLFEPVTIEDLAHFAYEQLIPMSKDKKLKLTYQPPKTKLPPVMADKEKLKQVMNNLIDNAIKYTKKGSVSVYLREEGGNIIFEVQDTGKGISDADKNAIFQKYSRGKESIKQSAGLGLGLYVAKIIIDQHKGKIWAESDGEGKGTRFLFSIPIKNDLKQTTLINLG